MPSLLNAGPQRLFFLWEKEEVGNKAHSLTNGHILSHDSSQHGILI